jgi:hypothetical protein
MVRILVFGSNKETVGAEIEMDRVVTQRNKSETVGGDRDGQGDITLKIFLVATKAEVFFLYGSLLPGPVVTFQGPGQN